jgi:hypothetical protein
MRLTRSLYMLQETAQVTHFSRCMRPTEGTLAPRLRLPLCLGKPHIACMQLLPIRRHAVVVPVRMLFAAVVAARCTSTTLCQPSSACCCGMHAPAQACGARAACFASCAYVGTVAPKRTTSICAHFLCLVMQHLQHKASAATYIQNE